MAEANATDSTQQPTSGGDAAIEQAVSGYREAVATAPSIHETLDGNSAKVQRPTASRDEFDGEAFAKHYGLPQGYLEGVDNIDEATKALNTYYGDHVHNANETARRALQTVELANQVSARVDSFVDSWGSKQFGKAESLTAEQRAARQQLTLVAQSHLRALHEKGGAIPTVEQLYNRVRTIVDPSFASSFRKQPEHANIHAAFFTR